jgi:hypothetical protein
MLVVEAVVPANLQIVLRLCLLEFLVIVGFHLDKGAEDVLIVVRIVVLQ